MGPCTLPSIPGPISHIDIRSMYPTLLRDRMYPCRFIKRINDCDAGTIKEYLKMYGVIATVTIYSDSGEFPLRRKEELIFPRGYFTTVLAGPDLEAIKEPDKIVHVHNAALYVLGRPYKEAAQFLLDARQQARERGDRAWEYLTKNLANSLGGKLAQRKSRTVERRDHVAKQLWGEWIDYDHDTKSYHRYQSKAGMVFEICRDARGEGRYTASFAYLTAYGRQLMRTVRIAFPPESILSQDTDGIWILSNELLNRQLCPVPFGDAPGNLRVVEVSNNGRFFGPKHYYVDSGWVLSGYSNIGSGSNGEEFRHTVNFNPLTRGTTTLPTRIYSKESGHPYPLQPYHGSVSPYGWINPIYIDETTQTETVE